ncbi:Predicted membrane protein [Candidatus Ornithobacterium hominis]|uniref:zinc ribbon domain-containing protein n=1 Tax=Candidatus Ornithobacterium hominis TaxID=2497989 RepID=UPI000E5C4CB4|nr:zinc ribbon domain-containing protein [Candidatus Ornithobacterium hominis]SZD73864.1 Predicted membrane protein [Candidatus Ornithobacterium hominis]
MYCIECEAQIPDNSKFCSHCGHKQTDGEPSFKEKLAEVIIEKEITRQVVEAHKSSIDYQFLKKAMGWYLAWVLIHLGLLLIGSNGIFDKSNMGSKKFWPFNDCYWCDGVGNYDITEFLVYTIFPLAILWSMIRTQTNDNEPTKTDD